MLLERRGAGFVQHLQGWWWAQAFAELLELGACQKPGAEAYGGPLGF